MVRIGSNSERYGWGEFVIDNLLSGVIGFITAAPIAAIAKYAGFAQHNPMYNPILAGVGITAITDGVEVNFFGKTLREAARNDIGTYVGTTIGYALGSLV